LTGSDPRFTLSFEKIGFKSCAIKNRACRAGDFCATVGRKWTTIQQDWASAGLVTVQEREFGN
jgi:hypothetical protein